MSQRKPDHEHQFPDIGDLRTSIRFDAGTGCIWLEQQRVMLLHTAAFGALRDELFESLGTKNSWGVLFRMGRKSGIADAHMARRMRPGASDEDAFAVGPQLHALEGVVHVTQVKFEMDVDSGHYLGEYIWRNSFEAEQHLASQGPSKEPVCWQQIGYASGYTSEFMKVPVVFKEVECVGKGDSHCRIIGKPLNEWDDAEELKKLYSQDSLAEELYSLQSEVQSLRGMISPLVEIESIVGQSPRIAALLKMMEKAANTDVTALMLGETGVGKEVFAGVLHKMGARRDDPFVAVNCATLPEGLVEAELFGVEKGAFTGAEVSRAGRFERAHGGTLFLDEIAELTMEAQSKLLRVLQEGEFDRVGDTRTRKVDVRLIAATNADLGALVREGKFRADLYYRINIFPIEIPPLRERMEDLPGLIIKFLDRFNSKYGRKVSGVMDKAMARFRGYHWPGNVRELENIIERGVILTEDGELIEADSVCPGMPSDNVDESRVTRTGGLVPTAANGEQSSVFQAFVDQGLSDFDSFEKALLQGALEQAAGNVNKAARSLGMSAPQCRYRLKKFGLN
ncbi:MAG: sigma 54-interacting transcriptional regulator [Proteobacteria bacterium]|nr:sigma 54-interacting transcriptional regulator [Pseudomonadota bacterium]